MKIRFALVLVVLASCGWDQGSGPLTLDQLLGADWDALEYQVVTKMPEEKKGGDAVVFLHGYGSRGSRYAPLAREILDDDMRVFLPTAVLPHSTRRGGAMWWEFLDGDWPKPYPADQEWPLSRQLPRARAAIAELISKIRSRYEPDTLTIGGHSQGAMLALDVAMTVEPPVDRVVAIAGYVMLDTVPDIEKPRERRPPVLVSHGRGDTVVWFQAAETMKKLLEKNDFAVTFKPHDGAHGIEPAVIRDLREFLKGR